MHRPTGDHSKLKELARKGHCIAWLLTGLGVLALTLG